MAVLVLHSDKVADADDCHVRGHGEELAHLESIKVPLGAFSSLQLDSYGAGWLLRLLNGLAFGLRGSLFSVSVLSLFHHFDFVVGFLLIC